MKKDKTSIAITTVSLVTILAMAFSTTWRLDAACSTGIPVCDKMASQIGDSTGYCAPGSTSPCSLLYCDALVNCQTAWATCFNNGTELQNVACILYIGVCNGLSGCAASPSAGSIGPRCAKNTGAGCQLAQQQNAAPRYIASK